MLQDAPTRPCMAELTVKALTPAYPHSLCQVNTQTHTEALNKTQREETRWMDGREPLHGLRISEPSTLQAVSAESHCQM